jgi:hypothetical protein
VTSRPSSMAIGEISMGCSPVDAFLVNRVSRSMFPATKEMRPRSRNQRLPLSGADDEAPPIELGVGHVDGPGSIILRPPPRGDHEQARTADHPQKRTSAAIISS